MTSFLAFAARALLGFAVALTCAAQGFSRPPSLERHFLWEVSSLTNHVYLFGTVHAGKPAWYPLPDVVEQAFDDSKVLVVEADITNTAAMAKTAPAMKLAPPESLKTKVAADDYAAFMKLLPRYGLREAAVADMKPFMAVSVLVFGAWARNGYQPQFGIDSYLIQKARAAKKPVVEIEGIEAQAQLMDSLTDEESRKLFKGTVNALDSGLTSEQIAGMVKAWQDGDAPGMLKIAQRYNETVPGAREFEEKFIWARHESMLQKIEGYLNNSRDRHFIAVGSLHLAGERGLVEMLKKRGYVVTQR
jgi:uncharacterized protein